MSVLILHSGRPIGAASISADEKPLLLFAFVSLVERLRASGFVLFDVQVMTDHLASLGCIELPRDAYLERLERARAVEARF